MASCFVSWGLVSQFTANKTRFRQKQPKYFAVRKLVVVWVGLGREEPGKSAGRCRFGILAWDGRGPLER